MADFTVDVPLNADSGSSGTTSSSGGSKDSKETNKLLKKLDKSILIANDPLELLTSLFQGAIKLLQPLVQLLNGLFVIIFLPLMPIVKELLNVTKGLIKVFSGEINIVEFIKQFLGPALANIGSILLDLLVTNIKTAFASLGLLAVAIWDDLLKPAFDWIGEKLTDAGTWVKDAIMSGFNFFIGIGQFIWESILKPAFDFLVDVGVKIWEIIKVPFEMLGNIGQWIFDTISGSFKWLANKIKSIWDWFKDLLPFGGGRASGGPVSNGSAYVVGEVGPELFVPSGSGSIIPNNALGGSTTIQINNPTVRNDADIKKIANEVSKVLMRETRNRFT